MVYSQLAGPRFDAGGCNLINMINIIETHKYIISTTLNTSLENQIQQCLNKDSLVGLVDYGSGNFYRYDDDMGWLTFRTIIQDVPIQDIEI